jgi:hypothetical protein
MGRKLKGYGVKFTVFWMLIKSYWVNFVIIFVEALYRLLHASEIEFHGISKRSCSFESLTVMMYADLIKICNF